MIRILTLVICLASFCVEADTITKSEYVGLWRQFHGKGLANTINKAISTSKNTLKISSKFEVTLTRVFSDHQSTYFARPENVKFDEDLLIIKFEPEDGGYYKLVLNGWSIKNNKQIFGMVYHYENNELINGVPLSFIKDS